MENKHTYFNVEDGINANVFNQIFIFRSGKAITYTTICQTNILLYFCVRSLCPLFSLRNVINYLVEKKMLRCLYVHCTG